MHEQNNKIIKGQGGASEFLNLEDESALIRCETRGADVGRILCQFEEEMKNDDVSFHTTSTKHYEDNEHFCLNFTERMYKLFSVPFPATHSNLIVFAPSVT